MLAMARVMVGEPRLLLIDEPSEGLAPMIVADLFAIIREMKQTGCFDSAGRAECAPGPDGFAMRPWSSNAAVSC